MPIPDYQSCMLPLLQFFADGKEHSFRDTVEWLAAKLGLTAEERKSVLHSGQSVFENRVGWARTYMRKAGLLDYPRRAIMVITERGLAVLAEKPTAINTKYLRRFKEFVEFQTPKKPAGGDDQENGEETTVQTPEEILEQAYQKIQKTLAQELLAKVMAQAPDFFERLVVELLVKMGYGGSIQDAGQAIGKAGDEGIDGIIKEDKLGLDVIYIQAKKWASGQLIGRPEIQKFVGALAGQGAKKGIFITTAAFTKDAKQYLPKNETKVVLIDGAELAQLMIDYGVGVSTANRYEIKRIDSDYFDGE